MQGFQTKKHPDSSPGSSSGFGSGGVAGVCFADSGVVNRLSLLSDANSVDLSQRALQKKVI